MTDIPEQEAAMLYRLAQAHKMKRLGLVELNENGEVVEHAELVADADGEITPEPTDFEAVQAWYRSHG